MRLIFNLFVTLVCLCKAEFSVAQEGDQLPRGLERINEIQELQAIPQARWANLERVYPRLQEIQSRWEERVLSILGVQSIGIGQRDGEPVFDIGIQRGFPEDRIPAEIEGFPTRVEKRDPFRLLDGAPDCNPHCHLDQLPPPWPAMMGVSARWIHSQDEGGCTAGFKACDLGTGRQVFVTNSHCAQASSASGCTLAAIGQRVMSPSPSDAQFLGVLAREIGRISGHAAPMCGGVNFVDATKVDSSPLESMPWQRDLPVVPWGAVPPFLGSVVRSVGRTTGDKVGIVIATNVTQSVPAQNGFCCGALVMRDQAIARFTQAVEGGDSGSAVIFWWSPIPSQNQLHYRVAGLLYGSGGKDGYFNSIGHVLSALNLSLDFGQCD